MFVLWQTASRKLNEISSVLKWLNGTSNSFSHLDLRRSGLKSQRTIKMDSLDIPNACFGCNPGASLAGSVSFEFSLTGLEGGEFTQIRHYVSFVTDTYLTSLANQNKATW